MPWPNLKWLRNRYLRAEAPIVFTGTPHVFIGHASPIVSLKVTAPVDFHRLVKWLDSTRKRRSTSTCLFDRRACH